MLRAAILASALLFSSVPEIIVIDVVQPEVPAAIKCEIGEVTEYNWTDDEIKQVAKILWAETGRGNTYKEKQCICYLILNRVRYGSPFAGDIVGVCKQRGEFNRGKVSDKNLAIARESLNLYQSQLDGSLQGIDFPMTAVYMARNNGILTFYDIGWNNVYEVK